MRDLLLGFNQEVMIGAYRLEAYVQRALLCATPGPENHGGSRLPSNSTHDSPLWLQTPLPNASVWAWLWVSDCFRSVIAPAVLMSVH
jgi:hypothetical protein